MVDSEIEDWRWILKNNVFRCEFKMMKSWNERYVKTNVKRFVHEFRAEDEMSFYANISQILSDIHTKRENIAVCRSL